MLESGYLVTLAKALSRAPLGLAYTVSRGGAVLLVWPVSVLWLDEPFTLASMAGAALVAAGMAGRKIRTQPLLLVTAGILCTLSFSLLLLALMNSGTGAVLTLRNTSIVFALALGALQHERMGRRQLATGVRRLRLFPRTQRAAVAINRA